MYLDHYHLTTKPFDLSPKPQFLWLGEKHKEALSTLKYGILGDLGFLLLTGDVGVGKTALIHRLINNLDASTIVAHITDPGLGTFDFFKVLASEFKIPDEFHSKGEFLIELEKFLKNAYADQKKVLLIVDEAQRLNNKLLDQIRVLSNIELSDRKLINIFFVGQPEFKTMLMANSSRALRQRIAINYHIDPLTESETGHYIQHRLKVAGATRKIFKPSAIPEIYRVTNGSPRAINILCDHALISGYAAGLSSIDSGIIKECEQELSIRAGVPFGKSHLHHAPATGPRAEKSETASHRSPIKGVPLLLGLGVVLIALLSVYLLKPSPGRKLQANPPMTISKAANVVEKEQARALPETEAATARAGVEKITRHQTGPMEKIDAADRQPVRGITSPSPAPAPLPMDSAPGTDRTATGQTEQMVVGPPDPPAARTEPPPEQVAWNEFNRQSATSTNEEMPGTDRQQAAADAPAEPETGPSAAQQDRGNDAAPQGKPVKDTPVLAALPDTRSDPPASRDTIDAQTAPPVGKEPVEANRQPVIAEATNKPEPGPLTTLPDEASDPAARGKTATNTAVLAVLPEAQSGPPASRDTIGAQTAPSLGKKPAKTDRQPPASVSEAGPDSIPSTGKRKVENDATASGKTEKGAPAAVAIAVAQPENTAGSNNVETPGKATVSPARSTTEKTPIKPKAEQSSPTKQNTPPEKETRAEPSLSAKAATGRSSNSEKSGSTAAPVAQSIAGDRENRLREFLQMYCNTYAAKDLDTFTTFFAPNAMENGKPFDSLLPKYERNFKFIETIQYRIELQQFSYDEDKEIVAMEGNFFLKWLPPDKAWRENSGKIIMSLKTNGPTFLVQRLEYHGNQPKKE